MDVISLIAASLIVWSFWREDGWTAGLSAAFIFAALYFTL